MGKGEEGGAKAPLRSATLSGLLRAFPGLSGSRPNLEVSSEKDSGTSGDLRALTETFGNFRRARGKGLRSTAWRPSSASGISGRVRRFPSPRLEALPPAEGGADENAKSVFRSHGTNRDLSQNRMSEPLPLSYVTAQEMRCLLHWLSGWTPAQRERFLRDLVDKAVPWKLLPLLESLAGLNVGPGKPPSIYECQMRLWDQWFRGWSEAERNEFVRQLEEEMPDLAGRFYREVAATAGQL